jgi:hypothetical protein
MVAHPMRAIFRMSALKPGPRGSIQDFSMLDTAMHRCPTGASYRGRRNFALQSSNAPPARSAGTSKVKRKIAA